MGREFRLGADARVYCRACSDMFAEEAGRREEIAQLYNQGHSRKFIVQTLGIHSRTVNRAILLSPTERECFRCQRARRAGIAFGPHEYADGIHATCRACIRELAEAETNARPRELVEAVAS